MRRPSIGAVALMVVLATTACADSPDTPESGPTAWTLTELYRLGGLDAPSAEQFGSRLTSLSLGPHGRLHVLDHLTSEIRVFDGDGAHVRTFAGSGRGPGELRAPSAMGWSPAGRLWVPNGFDGRYSVFDSTGDFVRTVPRPIHVLARVIHELGFVDDTMLVDETIHDGDILYLAVDTSGAVIDTFPALDQPPTPGGFAPSFDSHANLYVPDVVYALAPDGTVWFTRSDELRLVHRTLAGDTLAVTTPRHTDRELPAETRAWLDREFSKLPMRPADFEPAMPVTWSVQVLTDGRVLVQLVEEPSVESGTFEMFDPDGRFLGTVDVGFRVSSASMIASRGDTLYVVGLDELDVPFVVKGVLTPAGADG